VSAADQLGLFDRWYLVVPCGYDHHDGVNLGQLVRASDERRARRRARELFGSIESCTLDEAVPYA
jgi:hypothetical protein